MCPMFVFFIDVRRKWKCFNIYFHLSTVWNFSFLSYIKDKRTFNWASLHIKNEWNLNLNNKLALQPLIESIFLFHISTNLLLKYWHTFCLILQVTISKNQSLLERLEKSNFIHGKPFPTFTSCLHKLFACCRTIHSILPKNRYESR